MSPRFDIRLAAIADAAVIGWHRVRMVSGTFGGHPHGDALLTTRAMWKIGIVTLVMFGVHWSQRDTSIESAVARMPAWFVTGIWTFMAGAILLA